MWPFLEPVGARGGVLPGGAVRHGQDTGGGSATLGFPKWQAFWLISLPQAVKIAKPTYQPALVNLIQWTSVVGYVTITDSTRVINNTASRTMQPLFMIVVGMLLYLALAYLCYGSFLLTDKFISLKKKGRKK